MKIKKIFVIIFFVLFNISISTANDTIAFVDLNYVLTESKSGKKILDDLQSKNNSNLEFFKSKEQKLKKEQAEINKLKNILAAEEYNNKFSLFKKKVETYNQKKSKMIKTFEDSKNEELKKFFVNLNKLMNDYMLEKSINVILDKKNIVMANIKNDISDEILQLVNKNELSQ